MFVAGHTGMVGSAILRRLQGTDCDIITAAHSALDLTRQGPTENFISGRKPDVIIIAAARVGASLPIRNIRQIFSMTISPSA